MLGNTIMMTAVALGGFMHTDGASPTKISKHTDAGVL